MVRMVTTTSNFVFVCMATTTSKYVKYSPLQIFPSLTIPFPLLSLLEKTISYKA